MVTELEGLHRSAPVASLDRKRLERELAARAADIDGLLGRHVPQTRQILRRLIVGRPTCEASLIPGSGFQTDRGHHTRWSAAA